MNKNYRLTNACLSIPISRSPYEQWSDRKFLLFLEKRPYLRGGDYYFVFQRELSTAKGEHWQCYLEFNQQVYFSVLKRDFINSHLEPRKESQEQAIKYCQKKASRLSGPYQRGIPRQVARKAKKVTLQQSEQEEDTESVENNWSKWINKVITRIKKREFNDFEEIENENPVFFWKNQNFLKNIWNKYYPLSQLNIQPARVIWCFGSPGAGKSIWTKKMLRNANWTDHDTVTIVPQNLTGSDKIYFNIAHENKKVLVINEVDHEFPKHNNLITFIDRNAFLMTKGSQIRNNFQLIVINSLYRPEEVFGYLGKNVAKQVLRRIFNQLLGCKVYQIEENRNQIREVLEKNLTFTDLQFQDWYQPIVEEIKEPDYLLVEKLASNNPESRERKAENRS